MPLAWDGQMRLLRVVGLAEAVLSAAQASSDDLARAGLGEQVNFLMSEVHAVLIESDAVAAAEFERIVMRGPEVSAELKAAALVGWVNGELMTQARHEENASSQPRKRQTIGFKIRSPITREHAVPDESAPE
jgi:hypothetical protein